VYIYLNPVLPIAKQIIEQAINLGATDLHFIPSEKTTVYVRILGTRHYLRTIPNAQYELILTYFKFTAGMDIGESKKPQDGTIHQLFPSLGNYSLRLSTLPLSLHESLAIRILPQEESLPIHELFLFPNQLNTLKRWATHEAGMILITGPTGSGKSTTLYALIQSLLEESSLQIITLENPIEKKLDEVIQVEVNELAGITYHSGLKAALRHDPDLLMIGEIRDEATAEFAFQASLTGHLVFSTLHARDTVGTIHRLLNMGINKEDIEQSLLAVASIQLVPITRKNSAQRAAILEILDGDHLMNVIREKKGTESTPIQSFKQLRRKAYAYGFIPETLG